MTIKLTDIADPLATVVGDELLEVTATPTGTPTTKTVTPTVITATNTAAIATNVTAIGLNTAHVTADGSSHTFIDQSVVIDSIPRFATVNITDDTDMVQLDGASVLHVGTTAADNCLFFGSGSGNNTLTASTAIDNTGIGSGTLSGLTTGKNNVGIGTNAGNDITTGDANMLVGGASGQKITTATSCLGFGQGSLALLEAGSSFIAIGANAQGNMINSAGTISNSLAIGASALLLNTVGASNVAIGNAALKNANAASSTGCKETVAIGHNALEDFDPPSSGHGVAIGFQVAKDATSGNDNVMIGHQAGLAQTSAARQVLIGKKAGAGATSGGLNILVGYQAGDNLTTGLRNIAIGYNVDVPLHTPTDGTEDNQMTIGNLLFSGGSHAKDDGVEGEGTTVSGGFLGVGEVNPQGKLHVTGGAATDDAVPTLVLEQLDVSEEMIEFVSTIGTGNALEAVAAKTLTTTHFIKVTLPGSLTRYIPCGTIA